MYPIVGWPEELAEEEVEDELSFHRKATAALSYLCTSYHMHST